MKVTVITSIEKEISFPLFFKLTYETLGSTFYALFDEEKSMRIDSRKEMTCISTTAVADSYGKPNCVEITEAEFNAAFDETMQLIQSYMPTAA